MLTPEDVDKEPKLREASSAYVVFKRDEFGNLMPVLVPEPDTSLETHQRQQSLVDRLWREHKKDIDNVSNDGWYPLSKKLHES